MKKIAVLFCLLLINCTMTSCKDVKAVPNMTNHSEPITQASEEEMPIARYVGSVSTDNDDLLIYDFQIRQENTPTMQITFRSLVDDAGCQTITYELSEDFNPETIRDGLEVLDVNGDGINDFLIDLGIAGHMSFKACLVYDKTSGQYVFVEGFDELNAPRVLEGYVVTSPIPMELPTTFYRYAIEGTELRLVGTLSLSQNESQSYYTESELVNGEWRTVKDMVTADNIDLNKWGLSG